MVRIRGIVGPSTVHRRKKLTGRFTCLTRRTLMLIIPVLSLALAYHVADAQAARTHKLLLSESLPEQRRPFALAMSQDVQHFYVVAANTKNEDRRILNYEASGQLDPLRPELVGVPAPHSYLGVAVDNSNGLFAGYVYATVIGTNSSTWTIQQFSPDGEATAVTIGEAAIPPNGTPQAGGLPPVANPGSFQPRRIAVDDSSGDLFVTDDSARSIDQFTPEGTFVAQLAAGSVSETKGLAPDGLGHIFLANESALAGSIFRTAASPEGAGLFELDIATGACVPAGCVPIDSAPIIGVAFDRTRETIFTTATGANEEGKLNEYAAASGQLLGVTSSARLHTPEVGIVESTGEVIVADRRNIGESTIQIYGPAEVVPDVQTLPAEEVKVESATLKGEIGAAGVAGATCSFQYVTAEAFVLRRFEGAAEAPCAPAGPFSGSAMNPVSAHVVRLTGGTPYEYRLVGENENGTNAAEPVAFTTHGPTISGTTASGVTEAAATLEGFVNPHGLAATYAVEYVTEASFEANGFSGAVKIPSGGAPVGAGFTPVAVAQRVEGLMSGTAYRFRIVATSSDGTTRGQAAFFATFGLSTPALPDGRRYEQVSPIDKTGANVQGSIDSVQASREGSAITFFTNTGIPGGEGSQEFPTYLSSRAPDASGWSTQGVLPPGSYGPRAHVLGWNEDLSDVYDFATPAFGQGKLLRRSSAEGGLTQLGTIGAPRNPFSYAGSSADGQIALLESESGGLLPDDLSGKQNVYAYDRETGAVVLAGVLNPTTSGGQPAVPPAGVMAGSFGWWENEDVTFGGARGTYFTQAQRAISSDGSRIFFTAEESGQLYMRVNPFAPQSAMSSGLCTESTKACTVRISAPTNGVADPGTPAAFVGASADGTIVYFLDRGKLTADATGGSGYDLYRYNAVSGALSDLTLDSADKRGARVEGVLGMSTDGATVYFVAAGELAENTSEAPSGETNLYALDGGAIHFVARLGTNSEEALNWIPTSRNAGGSVVTHTSRLSSDGSALLFRSARQLTNYPNHGSAELYLVRSGSEITCISCSPSGQAPTGPSGVQEIPPVGIKLGRNYSFVTRNLSADGRRVVFDSPDQLVGADENNVNDVYEWEVPGKGTCTEASDAYSRQAGGCLYLISRGAKGVGGSYFGDADVGGENIFFFTAQPLVAQDKDGLVDIYDARVGGGIASQEAVPQSPCREEADCLAPAGGSPPAVLPRSPGATGINVVPPPRCKSGFVRRHGKCVRRRTGKKHRHKGRHHGKGKKRHSKHGKKGAGR